MLDPLLAPALQLAELPIIPARRWADQCAHNITHELERIGKQAAEEPDAHSSLQLMNLAEALGVAVISLVAYSRGRVPRVKSDKPPVNLIVPSGKKQ